MHFLITNLQIQVINFVFYQNISTQTKCLLYEIHNQIDDDGAMHRCRYYHSRTKHTVWLHHRGRMSVHKNLYKEAKNYRLYQSTDIGNKKQ